MIFRLEIECDGDDLAPPNTVEAVARILRDAAAVVGASRRPSRAEVKLRDRNGNVVGFCEFRDK